MSFTRSRRFRYGTFQDRTLRCTVVSVRGYFGTGHFGRRLLGLVSRQIGNFRSGTYEYIDRSAIYIICVIQTAGEVQIKSNRPDLQYLVYYIITYSTRGTADLQGTGCCPLLCRGCPEQKKKIWFVFFLLLVSFFYFLFLFFFLFFILLFNCRFSNSKVSHISTGFLFYEQK